MSLSVSGVAAATTPSLNAANLLTDLNLTTVQQAQISQILAELQTGTITASEARQQIDSIVAAQQQSSQAQGPAGGSSPSSGATTPLASVQQTDAQYYELPLPQEELPKGPTSAYTWSGASSSTVFSTPQVVNSTA